MVSEWVEELVTMANALVTTADEAREAGKPCRFCAQIGKGEQRPPSLGHLPDCPVSFARRVLRQAGPDLSGGLRPKCERAPEGHLKQHDRPSRKQ